MTDTGWRWTVLSATVAMMSSPALAFENSSFSIPAGRLDQAILILGRQGNVSIALSDPSLGRTKVRGMKGHMDPQSALQTILRDTGLMVQRLDGNMYRIIKRPRTPRPPVEPPRPSHPDRRSKSDAPPPIAQDIIVTASKRDTNLDDYAGSVSVISLDESFGEASAQRGTGAIVQRLPVLNSTRLGPGRNKLFIRGIADSSFTGPTQATVGQYLGDARINYNAPDPDLDLYDMAKVEVLEGPQGTLYGSGSLGGVIRLSPHLPDSKDMSATIRAGVSLTDHGDRSHDLAGMVNVPVAKDVLGLRLVGYRSVDGGYINDGRRNLTNINSSRIVGVRGALRLTPGDDWSIDAGLVRQDIRNRDGQYTENDQPPLTRASAVAQPFDNDYLLGYVTIGKNWGDMSLRWTNSIVAHDLSDVFDASSREAAAPLIFKQEIHIQQTANEARLSRRGADGHGWVIGFGINDGRDRVQRFLGPPDALTSLSHVANERTEVAAFGEWSFGLAPKLSAAVGGRLSRTRFTGELIDPVVPQDEEPKRILNNFAPLVSFSWKPQPNWLVYARYQEGFRPGGLAVSGLNKAAQFESDSLATTEIGTRFGRASQDRFSAALAASYTRWESIQADLLDTQGFPFTANIGDGEIWGISGSANWRPVPPLIISIAAYFNQSKLVNPAPGYVRTEHNDLPNVARLRTQLGVGWAHDFADDKRLTIRGNLRYFGRSFLGVGPSLDIEQGPYVDTGIDARLGWRKIGLTIGVSNVLNTDGNRFSYGNPFSVTDGKQQTPLRPRTLRIGLDAAF